MTSIFVSHASEDKAAVARPLSEALRTEYDVWYDEHSLSLGDSLREKIDEGLRSCDFGVVILSKAFFEKKWTRDELDGLFALERKNRKVILPVWHEVTKDEVADYSPMLAGRLAVGTEIGIPKIVEAIDRSVSASNRTRELTTSAKGKESLLAATRTVKQAKEEEKYLFSTDGVAAVRASAKCIVDEISNSLIEISQENGTQEFGTRRLDDSRIHVSGPFSISLTSSLVGLCLNSATDAKLGICYFTYLPHHLSEEDREILKLLEWKPKLAGRDEIRWLKTGSKKTTNTRRCCLRNSGWIQFTDPGSSRKRRRLTKRRRQRAQALVV